jgi:subtilisin family serine protease
MPRVLPIAVSLLAAACLTGPAHAGVVSQGAFRIGADALWGAGARGEGQTVAVLDLGFGGLDASIAMGELPPREQLTLMSFDPVSGINGSSAVGEPTEHGTRMAEIVHDVAPGAKLVLVNYQTVEQFRQAVDWVVSNGIPIVTHSNSFLLPPYDGTGTAARTVDAAAAAGVLWLNSVGNYAERHWAGRADAGEVVLPVQPRAGEKLQFTAAWPGADGVGLRLALERLDPSGAWVLAGLGAPAGPRATQTPVVQGDTGQWRVTLRQTSGPPAALEVWSRSAGFGPDAVSYSSVPTPGDAAGAIAVGAAFWTTNALASYSSRGPTDDGRMKPDLVAPTYVTANPAFPGTAGTSAATPHVAAAAALLRQARQAAGLPAGVGDLRAVLQEGAFDLGEPGPDNAFGHGLLRIDLSPPRVRILSRAGRRPLVRVRAADDGTMARLSLSLGSRTLAAVPGARLKTRLTLPVGRHRITATARDMAGNTSTVSTWVRVLGR